jgi:hypothetical protein
MVRVFSVFYLLLFLFKIKSSFAGVQYNGKNYPSSTDLSYQSRTNLPIQNGGFCHAFAAARLVEAACQRITGKKLDISEDYLVLRHLSSKVRENKEYDLERTKSSGNATYFDGGWAFTSLKRVIESRSVLLEDEFNIQPDYIYEIRSIINNYSRAKYFARMDLVATSGETMGYHGEMDFLKQIENIVDTISSLNETVADLTEQRECSEKGGMMNLTKTAKISMEIYKLETRRDKLLDNLLPSLELADKETLEALKSKVDESLRAGTVFPFKTQSGEIRGETTDRTLRNCLSKVRARKVKYTKELGLSLLARGIPYLCSGKYNLNGVSGNHVSMRTGYRYNEKMKGNIEWQHYDSNNSEQTWGWSGGCNNIIYIEP